VLDTILIVDDEKNILLSLKKELFNEPYNVICTTCTEEAYNIIVNQEIKVLISDELTPHLSGCDFLIKVQNHYPEIIKILLTGHATLESTKKAINFAKINKLLTKPWSSQELIFSIKNAIKLYNLTKENNRLLSVIKKQENEFDRLEKLYPGITNFKKDDDGCIEIKTKK